ncbi:MAG: PIN domain-containing protein, partial [Anaerolineae bacterium]|nr:PIN domain-containing protein [Anaerolineae bacterium]
MKQLLMDTNIFLEVILEQEKAEEAQALLAKTEEHELFISDYSLHSIGVLLFRRRQHEVFGQFVKDMMLSAGLIMISLPGKDMEAIIDAARRFNLDFDDAYQYVAAEKHNLT